MKKECDMSWEEFDYFSQGDKRKARNMKISFIGGLNALEYAYKNVYKDDVELCKLYRHDGQKAYKFVVYKYKINPEGDRQDFNRMLDLCIKCKKTL